MSVSSPIRVVGAHRDGDDVRARLREFHRGAKEGFALVESRAIDWAEPALGCLTVFRERA